MEDSDNESMTEITNIFSETHHATEAEQDVKSETDETHLNQEPKEDKELCSRKGKSMSQSEVEESNPQTGCLWKGIGVIIQLALLCIPHS